VASANAGTSGASVKTANAAGAGEAGGQVVAADGGAQPAGGLDEHGVGDGGAVQVGDALEAVEVDDEHAAGVGGGRAVRLGHTRQELAPVGQAGLVVGPGDLVEVALQLRAVADVADVDDDAGDLGGGALVADRRLGVAPPAEAVAEPGLDQDVLAAGEDGVQRLGGRGDVGRVQQVGEGAAQDVLVGEAELAGRRR
jgi:hypothetical protein